MDTSTERGQKYVQKAIYSSYSLDKPHSAGSLLLEAIENGHTDENDPYSAWFACVILSHILSGNEKAKEVAGKVTFGEEAEGKNMTFSLIWTHTFYILNGHLKVKNQYHYYIK